jgi:tetratricopeptide (TPR) repeat protein
VVAVTALASACTTQKSRSDQSALSELYHNTTAYYNGYFNANELLEASILLLEQQHSDNYTQLLPMYKYVVSDNAQMAAPELDEAIKKVSIVVNLHRYTKWTDDCYVLVGKAQYVKQDYESAEETFRYFVNEFSPEKMKKRKGVSAKDKKLSSKKKKAAAKKKSVKARKKAAQKGSKGKMSKEREKALKQYNKAVAQARKKGQKAPPKPEILQSRSKEEALVKQEAENPEDKDKKDKDKKEDKNKDNPLKHRPAYQEGMLWLARTLVERNSYDGAQFFLNELERKPDLYEQIKAQIPAVWAYLHIHRKDYAAALPALEKALETEKDRLQKGRYSYIIAQLHQMQGNTREAYAAFERSLGYRPGFEMEFNCKLNMAQNAWASGKGSARDAIANLEKLLKDEKNKEYRDQIYYSLAQIAIESRDLSEAIKNLELSLKYNTQNRSQQIESYLTLAGLYYETERYVPAKNYYDSTLMVMGNTDRRYKEVSSLSKNLTEIAANIQIIELQDSLLRLGKLSDKEKEARALEIKKKQDEERLQALANKAAGTNDGGRRSLPSATAGGGLQKESSFFAYDDRALKRGTREFERQWPGRTLEDNWRRSNKRESSFAEQEDAPDADAAADASTTSVLTPDEVKKYLGAVPGTDAERKLAELKMQEAMFKLGSLYRDRLQNLPKAIEVLEELERRFPGNNFELEAWYQLYLAYLDSGNHARSQYFADKILDKYQTSKYAMVIRNPNFVDELANEERKLNRYYDEAYASFTGGNYQVAFQQSATAKEKFGAGNALQPKFALLAAMSTGNLEGREAYLEALKDVIARYPNTPEQMRAREIIRLLGESSASLPGGATKEEMGQYKVEDEDLHYILIAFKDPNADLNTSKIKVSDFNEKYFKLDRLRISNIYLGESADNRLPILVLRKFKNKAEAMKYYNGSQKNSKDFISSDVNFEVFPVTQNNYREVLREKSVDGYRAFFQSNYLK